MVQAITINAERQYYSLVKASKESMTVGEFLALISDEKMDAPVVLKSDNGFLFGGLLREDILHANGYIVFCVNRDFYDVFTASQHTMKVSELVDILNKYSSDLLVLKHDNGYSYGAVKLDDLACEDAEDESWKDEQLPDDEYSEYEDMFESSDNDWLDRFKDWDAFADWFKKTFGEKDFEKLNELIDGLDDLNESSDWDTFDFDGLPRTERRDLIGELSEYIWDTYCWQTGGPIESKSDIVDDIVANGLNEEIHNMYAFILDMEDDPKPLLDILHAYMK